MFSKPEIVAPTLVLQRQQRFMALAPARMAAEFPKDIAPLRADYVKTMAKEPPPVPTYRRTHQLSTSWVTILKIDPGSGILTSYNGTPYKRFVQGRQARWFHIRRGWRQESDIVPVVQKQAAVIARGSWNRASNPTLGITR